MLILEGVALTVLSVWLALLLDPARRWPDDLRLDRLRIPEDPSWATERTAGIVALVPARDEAAVLPVTLPTLLAQCPPLEAVVLVDDASTDGTAAVAREMARRSGAENHLYVVAAAAPPAEWSGKLHALEAGRVAIAERWGGEVDWILLSDADIAHREGSVAALAAVARGRVGRGGADLDPAPESERDLVSIMARLRVRSSWEKLLIPPFVFFFHLLYPFRRVASDASPVAAAAGGCALVRCEALERAGGFVSIRSARIDDVALGRSVKQSGGRLWLGFDPGVRSVREYGDLGSLWRMVERSAFAQLGYRWGLLIGVLVAIFAGLVAPAVVALGVLAVATSGGEVSSSLARIAIWGGLTWCLQSLAVVPFVRHHRVPWLWAAAVPAAGVLYAGMTLSSALRYRWGGGVRWKGRRHG